MKARDVRELTDDEMRVRMDQARRELFNLRMQKSAAQVEKPSRIRELRRDTARMLTVRTERTRSAT
ncbi:MAG: 50S ribosomal protein L29 [Verrucomicrobia bacterium]|nr:50S ribosomal protein L29 [Verrucomicrobiota bacterium]OQW97881.1 MAG: 50S ribosomal protein L29 [Verrucomicrobia bacterium A1]